ncbi:MAG TPA: cytochrome c-type biogenesis protein CcmH [Thermoleophilaceae bacterium]|nr:cytochrome c-type biogenesis protein CcmH [Thermoleophilaceae bacterium]
MRRIALIPLLLAALLAAAPAASAAAPPHRASLSDLEDEVMCLVCGTTLNVSDSPQADRERAFIRALIDRGETKSQIKTALVAQYGPRVLASPPDSGFDLTVWIVPGLAVILAGIGIAFAVARWRRARPAGQSGPLPVAAGKAPAGGGDGARLRSDLERYDL